jgi:hypothetical protein
MRRYTRIVFGLNAVYHLALGSVCLLAPALAVGIYGGSSADQTSTLVQVCFRFLGINLVPIGVICTLVALNPDNHPILRQLVGLLSILSLVGWGIAISAHSLNVSQISSVTLDALLQLLVIIGVVGYSPSMRVRQFVVRRRMAA